MPETCCLPSPTLATVLENSLPRVKRSMDFNIYEMGFFELLEIFIWEQGLGRAPSTWDARLLELWRTRDELKASALFWTTSVSGIVNYPFHTSRSSSLWCFAGGAGVTCGLIPWHFGVFHIPQPQST